MLGRQDREGVVGSQAVLDTAREGCPDDCLALRARVDQFDSEYGTTGFNQPLSSFHHSIGLADSIPRDGGVGHPDSP